MPGGTLERIYYELPVWMQNGVLSLYGLQLARIRYNPHFFSLLDSLKGSEWWSRERIQAQQNEQISEIVRHAYRTVPFYRRWYDEHGVDVDRIATADDLKKLPLLSKQIVRELLTYMLGNSRVIEPGVELILMSRHFERIGDHATNIAEDVIFIVEARDVRHGAGPTAIIERRKPSGSPPV
jgi:hypothetical protein